MRVVELADEGVRPRLAGVYGHVHVILSMSLSPLLQQGTVHHPVRRLLPRGMTSAA